MSRVNTFFSKPQKDWTHQAVQKSLLSLLPEAQLEYRFPSISRIADAALLDQKIIFEIQCSPITLSEVKKRNSDYESLGFTVIWILHNRRFNKQFASPAELYIRQRISYYTSITRFGSGFFFDQIEFFRGLKRIYKGSPLILKSLRFKRLKSCPKNAPKCLKEKIKRYPYCLPGDLADTLLKKPHSNWVRTLEKSLKPSLITKLSILYRDFLHSLLYANQKSSSSSHKDVAKQNRAIHPSTE